jgi:RNA 2',3'-cyclic 3'-phosphodiesterase
MRLFLAIELSDPFRQHLARVQEGLGAVTKTGWTRPQNLHLTLKFLGEVPDERVGELCEGLRAVVAAGPIRLQAEQLLCFPSNGPVRIISAGLRGTPELADLVERIESACEPLGFGRERRLYRPHITLGRARSPLPGALRRRLADACAGRWPGPEMAAGEFILMASELSHHGSRYTRAATFELG